MAKTDSPLKQFVTTFIGDFATWVLGSQVVEATTRTIELSRSQERLKSDQIFFVRLANGEEVILHIEFQGRSTARPMSLRMLEYITLLILEYPNKRIHSVVIYVGEGVGQKDTGVHQVPRADSRAVMQWHYDVLRLWEMDATDLLALGKPELLPLIGQTRIEKPEQVIPQLVQQLQQVQDAERRRNLIISLLALTDRKGIMEMVKQMIQEEGLLLDTPFLLEIRQEGREEGREEGIEEGREEGILSTLRTATLETLTTRFALSEEEIQQLKASLEARKDETSLHTLFKQALVVPHTAAFRELLEAAAHASEAATDDATLDA